MRQTWDAFCRQNGKTHLLDQWDAEKNAPLTPQTVSYGSHRKVWWRCENGHSWQAAVYSRSGGTGCPYCTGIKVGQGNDLASLYPTLAAQWDETKNAPGKPSEVLPGSHRPVWWRCEKGHSWRAQINSRTSGCSCPVCAGKRVVEGENSLADVAPELISQWDTEKNGALTPRQIPAGTGRKVWWRCALGHSWNASIASRVNLKAGCPVCGGKAVQRGFNDLTTLDPALAGEWDAEKNGTLTPETVTAASNRKAWWRCPLGHSYRAVIASRAARKSGCPYCTNRKVLPGFNDLAAAYPELAEQWHPTLNGALTPQAVTAGSHSRVWWQCPVGHVWKAIVYARTDGKRPTGCPVCAGRFDGTRKARYDRLVQEAQERA